MAETIVPYPEPKAGEEVTAISLREPWASLMRTGAKAIETRGWLTRYRGPLLICASRRQNEEELSYLLAVWEFQGGLAPLVGKPLDRTAGSWPGIETSHLSFGHAVALVDLVDCVPTDRLTLAEIAVEETFGDYSLGRFGWITSNLRTFDPFPVRGSQGLFRVTLPADFAAAAPVQEVDRG